MSKLSSVSPTTSAESSASACDAGARYFAHAFSGEPHAPEVDRCGKWYAPQMQT